MDDSDHASRAASFGDVAEVYDATRPEVFHGLELGEHVLSIVHEDVDVVSQGQRSGVQSAMSRRSATQRRRAVVGQVGDGAAVALDPVAEGPAALVRDLARQHVVPVDRVLPGSQPRRSARPELARRDQESAAAR